MADSGARGWAGGAAGRLPAFLGLALLAVPAAGCNMVGPAVLIAADGVVLGLQGLGNTAVLREGGEPLTPAELPSWALEEDSALPASDRLREEARRIAAIPPKDRKRWQGDPFSADEVDGLRRFALEGRKGTDGVRYDDALHWDEDPAHGFVHSRGGRMYAFAIVFGRSDFSYRGIDPVPPRPVVRRGRDVSIPYSGTWTVEPAGADADDYLRGMAAGENDGNPQRYRVEETHQILFGLFGWGRINRERYVQILWIPIPTGSAE